MLLSPSHLENQDVVPLVGASRNPLRLATMLSLTLSRSPQLLRLDSNTQREKDLALGLCFHCKKHEHIMSACPKLRAERKQKDVPVQMVSTLPSQVTQG